MATFTVQLTPTSDTTPAVVVIDKELSGAQWCARYPGSVLVTTLRPSFQLCVSNFLWALQQSGAKYSISNTFRPLERAYMMHWAWKIWHDDFDPAKVPPISGVLIEWLHPSRKESKDAAEAMVNGFSIRGLRVAPALATLHSIGEAIDMDIAWNGTLRIEKNDGSIVEISSQPHTGMNVDLWKVGAAYGVVKFVDGDSDRPHWSTTGH